MHIPEKDDDSYSHYILNCVTLLSANNCTAWGQSLNMSVNDYVYQNFLTFLIN